MLLALFWMIAALYVAFTFWAMHRVASYFIRNQQRTLGMLLPLLIGLSGIGLVWAASEFIQEHLDHVFAHGK